MERISRKEFDEFMKDKLYRADYQRDRGGRVVKRYWRLGEKELLIGKIIAFGSVHAVFEVRR